MWTSFCWEKDCFFFQNSQEHAFSHYLKATQYFFICCFYSICFHIDSLYFMLYRIENFDFSFWWVCYILILLKHCLNWKAFQNDSSVLILNGLNKSIHYSTYYLNQHYQYFSTVFLAHSWKPNFCFFPN